jgi:GNAT superfamily N-acetyltransferase
VTATAVVVRSATISDVDAIVRCQAICWREAYAGLVAASYLEAPDIGRRRHDRWRARLQGGRQVAVAEAGPEMIGVASSGPSRDDPPEPPLELMSLYVRAEWHGTGVADRLLAAAIGTVAASLWVFEANPRALGFYARHGFRPDGRSAVDPDTGLVEIRLTRAVALT